VRRPERFLLILVALLLILIWGTTWAAIRIGLRGIPPFTGVALRFAISSVVLLVVAFLARIPLGRSRQERRLWIVNTLLTFCGSYGVVYWCEQYVPSGLAAVIFATFPLFVTLFAHLALPAERMKPRASVGILLGFCGAAVIYSEDFSALGGAKVALASGVMLASPLVSALATVAVKRWGKGVHPLSLSAVPMGFASLAMGAVALATERHSPVSFDAASLGALLYLALLGSAVSFSLWYWLLSHAAATRVSLISYLNPMVAVSVGILFLREPITGRILAGSALVVAGVALAVHSRSSR
jgi:drug/metabolite transporter (DMT)-like permease